MTKLNVDLLLKVKQHILLEPARLRMDTWVFQSMPGEERYTSLPAYGEPEEYTMPKCGTIGCIAGWACMLGAPNEPHIATLACGHNASELLKIDPDIQPWDLYFPDQWPQTFFRAYQEAIDAEGRAEIVADVIDQFISDYQTAEQNQKEA